jgi:hypothetical protein
VYGRTDGFHTDRLSGRRGSHWTANRGLAMIFEAWWQAESQSPRERYRCPWKLERVFEKTAPDGPGGFIWAFLVDFLDVRFALTP